jgi:hypothetical protein
MSEFVVVLSRIISKYCIYFQINIYGIWKALREGAKGPLKRAKMPPKRGFRAASGGIGAIKANNPSD